MPLINESYDSLPYVDTLVDEPSLAAARAAIAADLRAAGVNTADLHPALAPAAAYTPRFSDFIEREHARLDGNPASKLSGIDLKRYEDLDAPENTSPASDEDRPELLQKWSAALRQANTSSEYVQARLTQLGLLEKFGKNAWLVGNAQLEDVLKGIEAELADVRRQHEEVETARRAQQDNVHGEIKTLEETWKAGVGRVLETEVAAEGLKQQILERRRAGAV
ncbi:Pre-mRNA-splicing factor SPF27 [Boeremia exigua]|uniref:Pre-mRNA-splicing factor SPF27 n=1 Tax=Boeremia exigua TaxID=749465 RepID=UPI001E8DE2DF|nr:Pre-mRNA-splicing factor SPF27 [Boeremia exigua]KAH6621744.1 Pre-mRNA-splicing factor SPF27 [Boeremia exigua]